MITQHHANFSYAGLFATALRWVVGWTYFSAFWRRLILENKLNPDEAGYIGEKFNHFLPHALGIKPIIKYLVSNPDSLWWAMAIFTIVEGIVGLFFMLGLFTRLMSLAVFGLAMGILLGSGWLGTTCLDEWQIGILGLAAGFTIYFCGAGPYSLDHYLLQGSPRLKQHRGLSFITSGPLFISEKLVPKIILGGSLLLLGLTLFTNQYFHGGVYGKLHNLSVRPHVTISNLQIQQQKLNFTVFRDEGADVYGSFLIGIEVRNNQGDVIFRQDQQDLAQLAPKQIKNEYVAKVKSGKYSLILPLGAKAHLSFEAAELQQLQGQYTLVLVDISGAEWSQTILL